MKYKAGDVVKLRDDLKHDKYYGDTRYDKRMDIMKNNPIEIKKATQQDVYLVFDNENLTWFITDEMIEGLWEECKGITYEPYKEKTNKYKLIDILNKIANGELKEGTKVKWDIFEYTYKKDQWGECYLERKKGEYDISSILDDMYLRNLTSEVELIEPDHFTDVGKMAEPTECEHEWKIGGIRDTIDPLEVVAFQHCEKCGMTKIMETKKQENHKEAEHFRDDTKILEPTDNTKIEELDINALTWNDLLDYQKLEILFDKLNEVIRYINK